MNDVIQPIAEPLSQPLDGIETEFNANNDEFDDQFVVLDSEEGVAANVLVKLDATDMNDLADIDVGIDVSLGIHNIQHDLEYAETSSSFEMSEAILSHQPHENPPTVVLEDKKPETDENGPRRSKRRIKVEKSDEQAKRHCGYWRIPTQPDVIKRNIC